MICIGKIYLTTAAVIYVPLYIFRQSVIYVRTGKRSTNTLKILKENEKLHRRKKNKQLNNFLL